MFPLDDDIVIKLYDEVPWLLLLNLLVMFLLILLCYYSTVFVFDDTNEILEVEENPMLHKLESRKIGSDNNSWSYSQAQQSKWQVNHGVTTAIKVNAASSSTSTTRRRYEKQIEGVQEGEKLSTRIGARQEKVASCSFFSPCRWLQLVSKAFLSCLGLQSTSSNDPSDELSNSSSGTKQHKL